MPRTRTDRAQRFLDAYDKLCREHKLCLLHEDTHGGFIIGEDLHWGLGWVSQAYEEFDGEKGRVSQASEEFDGEKGRVS